MTRTEGRRTARRLLGAFVAIGAVGFVWSHPGTLAATARSIRTVDLRTLAIGVLLMATGVANRAAQTRWAYRAVGLRGSLPTMLSVSAAAYGGNKIAKSGGLVGLTVFLGDARRRDLDRTRVAAAYVINTIAGTVALAALLGLYTVWSAERSPFVVPVVIATVAIARSRRTSLRAATERAARRLTSRLGRIGRCGAANGEELLTALDHVVSASRRAVLVVFHALVGKVIGALTLYVVVRSLGADADLRSVLGLYAFTLLAAALGPLPAGIGAAEASLVAALVAHGMSASTAMTATIVFRLFDLWLPLLAGGVAAVHLLRSDRAGAEASSAAVSSRAIVVQPVTA